MAVKTCCIDNCNSSSNRKQDVGVTYHKFPKDTIIRDIWVKVTRHKYKSDSKEYVCSRHFCKSDFQIYKESKYILKSDAVPSIYPWTMAETNSNESTNILEETPTKKKDDEVVNDVATEVNSSNESAGENLEDIRKFIEDQEKAISEADTASSKSIKNEKAEISESTNKIEETSNEIDNVKKEKKDEPDKISQVNMAVATSVMNMILNESEAKIDENRHLDVKPIKTEKGNNSMALSVGSKVEAKDFEELWHSAEIAEVDYEEMEVLVHYNDSTKKHDEWISVSSPRLRPSGSKPPKSVTPVPIPEPVSIKTEVASPPIPSAPPKEDHKVKFTFEVGERCLARWRDNRRFIATITADLGDGKYEIVFDDGVKWTCNVIRLSKLKNACKNDPLNIDVSGLPTTGSTLSPVYGPGPGNTGATGTPNPPATPALPFNTHLFDPTRDYLSSKSERREMKRKLNIKEIFNIGQKKKKIDTPKKSVVTPKVKTPAPKVVKEVKPKVVRKKKEPDVKVKKDIPDAVASIIGTLPKDSPTEEVKAEIKEEEKTEDDIKAEVKNETDEKIDIDDSLDLANSETLSAPESQEMKQDEDSLLEEAKLEKFEQPDEVKHEEEMDRIKEAISKLEGDINEAEVTIEKEEVKSEIKAEIDTASVEDKKPLAGETKEKKNLSKIKKIKKVKLKREKKVKKQVEKVRTELEEMKKQVDEMRRAMAEELSKKQAEMPESFLLPGEWCCKWVNGTPIGKVSEMENETKVDVNNKPVLPKRSVQVEDKRLPPGWTKHMVRRSLGSSAGKWDVVLMSPDRRRLHTKTDMRNYLEHKKDESLIPYEAALMDFGIHLKLSRRMGWYTTTPEGDQQGAFASLPAGTLSTTSALAKKKHLGLKKGELKQKKRKKLRMKLKVPVAYRYDNYLSSADGSRPGTSDEMPLEGASEVPPEFPPLEDGYVYVGSLKVQILENLLRCPAEGCYKNFRNNTLLKMHIKHYHRELLKMLGATPKVLDLAYARTRPSVEEMKRLKFEAQRKKFKVKFSKLPKKTNEPKSEINIAPVEMKTEPPIKSEEPKIPRSQDSPKLRNMLQNKPVKRPKVLLPVRKAEPTETVISGTEDIIEEDINVEDETVIEPSTEVIEPLDFETAISTHTVTKPVDIWRKTDKKKKFASISKASEDDEWYGVNSDVETRSSYPRSGTPDSKMDQKLISSESNEEQKEANYMYTETGERIKLVHMKREEIINCHCGFREEDGLMVQCELCLCWQHALCHNIQRESEVPEKYTCSICLNPRRGRRSQRFLHDQDRLYEGLLPGAKPCESLRRSHELSGNLHRIEDALQALRVKYYVATKKDHPKLYLWAKDWEMGEIAMTQEKLNSDYSDLSIMISSIGKENLRVKAEDMKDMQLDIRTPPSEEPDADRYCQKDSQLGSQALLSGLLSSPGGASLDLPITTTELEKLASTVQAEQEAQRVIVPQPEAAIENSACRERLLRHLQRCQALVDARLDSIEAHVAELESQDPSFEDDETADYFPRTKQTIQMLMRDLDTMEELGVIT